MRRTSTVDQALRSIEAQIASKAHRSGVLKLADALCFTYRIPEGRDLVLVLQGDSRIRSNREAVAAWVQQQMVMPGPLVVKRVLPILVDLLGRKLRSIYEEGSCL